MTTTILGQLLTAGGEHLKRFVSLETRAMLSPVRHRAWMVPASEVRSTQPPSIPLTLLGATAGKVTDLGRRDNGDLWAVCEIADGAAALLDRPHYLAPVFSHAAPGVLDAVELVERSSMLGAQPVALIRSGIDQDGKGSWRLDQWQREMLERGRQRSWTGGPLLVHGHAPVPDIAHQGGLQYRWRSSTEIAVTRGRTIELIVIPSEQEALVVIGGKMVTEIVSAGAFAGTEHRADRIRVNRDHDVQRTVGGAISLDPYAPEGLVAQLKIAKTALGDETLALAEDGCLDASAGYRPMGDGETWETRERVRITKAFLGHIAMTPDPAYPGAKVLAVRHSTSRTPHLDRVRAQIAAG